MCPWYVPWPSVGCSQRSRTARHVWVPSWRQSRIDSPVGAEFSRCYFGAMLAPCSLNKMIDTRTVDNKKMETNEQRHLFSTTWYAGLCHKTWKMARDCSRGSSRKVFCNFCFAEARGSKCYVSKCYVERVASKHLQLHKNSSKKKRQLAQLKTRPAEDSDESNSLSPSSSSTSSSSEQDGWPSERSSQTNGCQKLSATNKWDTGQWTPAIPGTPRLLSKPCQQLLL